MSSRSVTSGGGLNEKTRVESQLCEASSPQTPPSQPNTWPEHNAPVRSISGIETLPLPSRIKLGSAGDKPREFFRRLRRQPVHPVHPACLGPSINSEERSRPRGEPAQCDLQEVLDKVLPRTNGVAKYPEFDAAGLYFQSEDVLKVLWHAETERLIKIAKDPDTPLEFSSISKGQCILESVVGMGEAEPHQDTFSSLGATYELVNYISAVLTRLVVQTSPGSYWQTNVLSVTIKRITKIKLLLIDLPANIVIGAKAAGAFLSKIRESIGTKHNGSEIDEDEECEEYMRIVETKLEEGLASFEEKQAAAHCVEQSFKSYISSIKTASKKNTPTGLKTTLQWKYCGDEDNRSGQINIDLVGACQRLRLNSMDEVITAMVPLVMTCPIFLSNFTGFRHLIALTGLTQDDVQPLAEGNFGAFFRMTTSQIDSTRRPDVLHLSEALDWYVWGVISIAVLFAAGGLGVGFNVGQRINGVDPSNLATYLWVVAAFIVLVGKSMKVKEWTWNDFLRGRVRCCSVSELRSVTRIDGQLIIAKLLHDERRGSVLNIHGPYNSAFLRRSPEGFSIDKPISSSTLLISGLTMLKVVTAKGHALVCLDFRRGTDLRVIGHIPDPEKEHLICEQIDRLHPGVGVAADGAQYQTKHAFSRSKDLKWKRVQGIYEQMDAKFV
ncbi:hypothetical protein CSAL01_10848 [Colletotrichum salicis]|uniref:Uncharacterized protein n=1 Tax=Colletotrichum salicis TaxID=1209931 RepID=A0A135USM7_9PEZI|nr:hypothetical protein CSAL01_10848 [Colletotrichum salicis]